MWQSSYGSAQRLYVPGSICLVICDIAPAKHPARGLTDSTKGGRKSLHCRSRTITRQCSKCPSEYTPHATFGV